MNKGHVDIARMLADKGAKTSSFMASIRLRLLLNQKPEAPKKNELEEEPRKQEQKKKDNSVDDPNGSQSPDMAAISRSPRDSLPSSTRDYGRSQVTSENTHYSLRTTNME